jgi:hypothetical protein
MSKTPREILLDHHRAADARLERICTSLLADQEVAQEPESQSRPAALWSPARLVSRAWAELFWCCRHIWGGLAAAWVLVVAFQLSSVESTPTGKPRSGSVSTANPGFLVVQKRLLSELREAAPAPPPPPPVTVPQTRSELPAMNLELAQAPCAPPSTRWEV